MDALRNFRSTPAVGGCGLRRAEGGGSVAHARDSAPHFHTATRTLEGELSALLSAAFRVPTLQLSTELFLMHFSDPLHHLTLSAATQADRLPDDFDFKSVFRKSCFCLWVGSARVHMIWVIIFNEARF